MSDPFNSPSPQLADPVDHAFSISPHATNPIAFTTRAIYVGGAGTPSLNMVACPWTLPVGSCMVTSTATTNRAKREP